MGIYSDLKKLAVSSPPYEEEYTESVRKANADYLPRVPAKYKKLG